MTKTFNIARKNMVINQLRPNKINEVNILNLFENIPKEDFLNNGLTENCYLDKDLDLSTKRGYLKNLHLAQIIKYSEITMNDKVLHIGGLTGYFSVLISSLCKELYVIEEDNIFFNLLEKNLKNSGKLNIKVFQNKLIDGFKSKSPFNLIIIDGPLYKLEENLKKQINGNGGRLVYIHKISEYLSKAYKIIRNEQSFSKEFLFDVMTKYQIQEKEEVFNF